MVRTGIKQNFQSYIHCFAVRNGTRKGKVPQRIELVPFFK